MQVCDAATTMAKPECEPARKISLTPDYYKGDRSMRESGFDISFRFGPYGAATHHYAPICLNSLLYKTEKDLQAMAEILGRKDEVAEMAATGGAEKGEGSRNICGIPAAGCSSITTSKPGCAPPTNT